MKLSIDKQEKYATIVVEHDKLTSIVSPELKSLLLVTNNEGFRNIIVDLSKVDYCDSSGLSAVLVGNRLCRAANGSLILTGINEHVGKLISISQLDHVLTMLPTHEEAVDLIFMEELEKDFDQEQESDVN